MKRSKVFKSLFDLTSYYPDEQACRDALAVGRWGDTPVCVHCGSTKKIYKIAGGKLLKCTECRKPFSVKVGTIFEDSAVALQKWYMALWLITSHKKGISSLQLHRDLGVTQKTAWFMLHRLRYALANKTLDKPLDGIVEVDETYVGGIEGNKHAKKRSHTHGLTGKTPVFGMLDRDDKVVVTLPVKRVNAKTLKGIMKSYVDPHSVIMSDNASPYRTMYFEYNGHESVDHMHGEYVRDDVHTQNIDSFWSLLKRGIIGIYHQVSVDHLHRYCTEFSFRYNSRGMKDADRFSSVLSHLNGRLTYGALTK